MKKLVMICAVVMVVSSMASATITVDMFSAGAPNVFGSSSYTPWWSNAQAAIRGSLTSQGSGNSEYIQLSNTGGVSADQPGYQAVTSGFDSWQGILLRLSVILVCHTQHIFRIHGMAVSRHKKS